MGVALTLAIVALVLLLGVWGRLPTVEAREPAIADTGSADTLLSGSNIFTYFVFLPILFKSEQSASELVFYDDFSNSNSGWPKGKYGNCEYAYKDGRYRITITDNGQRCYAPNLLIPKQVNGTFSVQVRRTTDEERHMLYGLIFGAKPVPYAAKNHWALEVYPNDDPNCDDKPFFWLVALVNDEQEYWEDKCTDGIDTDRNDWNELKVVRNGRRIDVYINGDHKEDYHDANELLNEGYSFVEALSLSDDTITVEFDDFEIRDTTTTP